MAIFDRFKKSKPTTASLPSQSTSASTFNSQQQSGPYLTPSQPSWTYVEQRPDDSQGYRPAQSQGWLVAPTPPQYQPVLVPQNYLAPPLPQRHENAGIISRLNTSVTNLLGGDLPQCIPGAGYFNNGVCSFHMEGTKYLCQGAALCDLISSKFDNIITLIDGERFSGDESQLVVYPPPQPMWQQQHEAETATRGVSKGKSKGMVNNSVSSALVGMNYFAKVNLYANSRLPPNLPPMKLFFETFRLLSIAAQYSEHVYTKPTGKERETHVDDWRHGTKAMVIKSIPIDDMNVIVFAIRGTQTFMDWAVNLNSAPASPEGFLDDPGNFCHAGFLSVAKKMIAPVAARLRNFLQEDPSRARCSLLITGHSAGGAIAALLYSHMLATSPEAESELNILTGCFKRIHCVSFGAPPVSLLPLERPSNPLLRKSIFLSFVNEGDPVARADKPYIRSLLSLYTAPAPGQSCLTSTTPQKLLQPLDSSFGKSSSSLTVNKVRPDKSASSLIVNKIRPDLKKSLTDPSQAVALWPVPEATLSNAGRIVLLRSVERYETRPNKKKQIHERMNEGVVAQMISDELLRGVVWGDPVCHMMRLYKRRIEILATNAVMGRS